MTTAPETPAEGGSSARGKDVFGCGRSEPYSTSPAAEQNNNVVGMESATRKAREKALPAGVDELDEIMRQNAERKKAKREQENAAREPKQTSIHDLPEDALAIWRVLSECEAHGLMPTSDAALTRQFVERHGDELRFVTKWGRWVRWSGHRWQCDEVDEAADLARVLCVDVLHVLSDALIEKGQRSPPQAAKTWLNVERAARAAQPFAATAKQWDADPWLLATPGGTVDLRAGTMRAADRSDYITKAAAVAPDFTRDCPLWRSFLHRVTGGDAKLVDYLQLLVGYCLTGIISEHMLAFLFGDGANGKSTFINLLTWLLADYATVAPPSMLEATTHERHPADLASLRGARLVSAIETEQGRRWAEARVKTLTGGDPITARFMRQDFFTFDPTFKILIAGNHKPSLRNVDPAMSRRLHMVPFTVEIPEAERDGDLPDKLRAEGPAILAWAIDGCMAWQRCGLHRPAAVRVATDEYLAGADAFGLWLADATEPGHPHEWELSADLMKSWKAWAEAAGEHVGSLNTFADRMRRAGYDGKRQSGTGKSIYPGIRMNRHDYANDARYGA